MKTQVKYFIFPFLFLSLLSACVGDDFIDDFADPVLRITSSINALEIGTTFQFEKRFLNNIGREEQVAVDWLSTNPAVISIDNNGLGQALSIGSSTIKVSYTEDGLSLMDTLTLSVGESTVVTETVITGSINTTTFYTLEGDFELRSVGDDLMLELKDNYLASSSLPGLYVYLSNNRNSIADAQEIGRVTEFSGAHSYTIRNTGINDFAFLVYFCKPFNVKVGDGEIQN